MKRPQTELDGLIPRADAGMLNSHCVSPLMSSCGRSLSKGCGLITRSKPTRTRHGLPSLLRQHCLLPRRSRGLVVATLLGQFGQMAPGAAAQAGIGQLLGGL